MSPNPNRKSLLQRILGNQIATQKETEDPRRGRLLLEALETRAMLAGDADLLFTDGVSDEIESLNQTSEVAFATALTTHRIAEGEEALDLVQFAKDLSTAGVKYFGAAWCSFCTQQAQLFEDGGEFLPFIEVTNPDQTLNSVGTSENIEAFPTWEFPDGTRATGVQTLETLSQRSGVAIPQSSGPSFVNVGNQTVLTGSPLHVPINAYSPTGEPLTITVSSADPSLVEASVLTGNRSIRFDLEGYNDMVFELFEQRAETASGRVIQLAQQGFYDGIIFHRVIDNFVIQGGDPTGTGTSGSNLGNFADDFHPELQHNREGVLSFAKSSDDTNNSQFFITEVPTRFLDFNHSVFGQIVEGSNVREAISETAVNSSDRPLNDVTISTIDVFNDTENGIVLLKAVGDTPGSTTVTVTVTDPSGTSVSETFNVSVDVDTSNSQPYLDDLPASVTSSADAPATLQLSSIDIEDDPVTYFAQSLSSSANGSVTVDSTSGLVTVTPATGFAGTITAQVGVRPAPGVVGNGASDSDTQRVSFVFEVDSLPAPASLDLISASDTGSSDSDNITRSGSLSFSISGVTSGATVNIVDVDSNSILGTGTASGSTATITTSNIAALGDGTYRLAAYQALGGVTSSNSSVINLTYDTTPPDSVTGSASTQANVGRAFETDLISSEEGSGLQYGIASGPTGLSINATTGILTWTPTASQLGNHDVDITLTDAAGNVRSETLTITVADAPTAEVQLEITDLAGNAISSISVGDSFLLRMNAVDARPFNQPGIYAAYADILFDPNLVEVESGSEIEYGEGFTVVQKGTVLTGEINELGAVSNSIQASNVASSHIATVRFRAIGSGTVNFRTDPADDIDSEFLMFGIDNSIPASAISYGTSTVNIGQSYTVEDDTVTIAEDTGLTVIDVLSNDQVLTGDGNLTVIQVTQPESGGTASLNTGIVSFTPDADFNGTSTFTYRVSDNQGIQQTATVTVTVESVNDPPNGNEDSFTVNENSANNFLNVLLNDSALPDTGETLRVTALTPSGSTANGASISIAPDGVGIFYQPATDFSGIDTFNYTLSDGSAEQEVGVTVTVENPDNPPTANDDNFEITEDDPEAEFDLLANDQSDIDGQSFLIESVSSPSNGGNVRISEDGLNFFYQPLANFNGTESFTYVLRDSGGGSAIGNVSFNVQSVNDPPPVLDLELNRNRGGENQTLLQLSDLPENPDAGETLTLAVNTPTAAGGTVQVDSATQTILYTPAVGFIGTDTVSYTVSDGSDLTASGTITIEVTDYEPRTIQVTLPRPVSNLKISNITLTGTDLSGNAVNRDVTYNDERAAFSDLLPGDYTLRIPAIPFLQNAQTAREIPISSAIDDLDTTVDSGLGRLRPEYISIRDWLRSTPKNSILVAVSPGESSLMVSESSEVDLDSPEVSLDGTGALLTIQHTETTNDDNGGTSSNLVQATVDTSDRVAAQRKGEADGLVLFRVATDTLAFTPVLNANDNAEGEFMPATPPAFPLTGIGEGESLSGSESQEMEESSAFEVTVARSSANEITLPSVTVADVFVPSVTQTSESVILPTREGQFWVANVQSSPREELSPPSSRESVDQAMELTKQSFLHAADSDVLGADSSVIDQIASEEELKRQAVDEVFFQQVK